jgi:type IV pilus assembly protein PilP
MSNYLRGLVCLPLVCLLTACGAASEDELRQWMTAQHNMAHPKAAPISEPKQFQPENYVTAGEVEPFSNQKLTQALKRDSSQAASNGALIAPELARRKEPLEEFPVDSMAMVGSMIKEGKPVALITVGKLLYQVHEGDHIGLNFGRATKISETEVSLREIVQDAAGEWIERPASLQLQERSK